MKIQTYNKKNGCSVFPMFCGLMILCFFGSTFVQTVAADDNLAGLWNGSATLGAAEHVVFTGTTRIGAIKTMARITLITVGSNTYAFFRQQVTASPEVYEIYRAVSTDGVNFTVEYNPVIAIGANCPGVGNLTTAYDPDIIENGGSYWLCFEGCSPSNGYGICSFIAQASSITGTFEIKSCAVKANNGGYGASAPNFLKSAVNDDIFLTWPYCNPNIHVTGHHQAQFPGNSLTERISNDCNIDLLPQPTGWANNNFGAASCIYEAPYYYMFYEGADNWVCGGTWGIGFCRTSNIYDIASWVHYPNPLLLSTMNTSCWMGYPKIYKLSGKYYLYYCDWLVDYPSDQSVYRRKIKINTTADFDVNGRVDFQDLGFLIQTWLEGK